MHYIIIMFMLLNVLCYKEETIYRNMNKTSNAKSNIELNDVKIIYKGSNKYKITGLVNYPNKDICDYYYRGDTLVCILSDEVIPENYFPLIKNTGQHVNCYGNVLDETIEYETEEANYFGCAVVSSGSVIGYIIYEVSTGFPVWAIVVIVVVILAYVGGFSLLYYKRKRSKAVQLIAFPLI